MSTEKPLAKVKGAVNVQRRVWDKEEYEKRAIERAAREAVGDYSSGSENDEKPTSTVGTKREFAPADPTAAGPAGSERAFLRARDYELNLEEKLNKRRIVTDKTPVSETGGYYCEVCDCTLRDSAAYLDHINGKRHQRKLGYSMRVESASLTSVQARLAKIKEEKLGKQSNSNKPASNDVMEMIKRNEQKAPLDDNEESPQEKADIENDDVDPLEMMLGFSGFGGSKK